MERVGLAAIESLARTCQGDQSLGDRAEDVCAQVAQLFDLDHVCLLRHDPSDGTVDELGSSGARRDERGDHRRSGSRLPLSGGTSRSGTDGRIDFALPLTSGDRCLGFLTGDRIGKQGELARDEAALLNTIAVVLATLLEKDLWREQMQRMDSLRSEFIGFASHELRGPLAAIYGLAVTLDERAADLPEAARLEAQRRLREEASRARVLTEQLLDLSRSDAGAIQFQPRVVDLHQTLAHLIETLHQDGGQPITLHAARELEAEIDPLVLDRILSNLLTNAIHHGAPPITITADKRGAHLHITVEDAGDGVPDHFVPILFHRFSRNQRPLDAHEGSGLGLAIARTYTDAHHGRLDYEPVDPHGARFHLELPQPD